MSNLITSIHRNKVPLTPEQIEEVEALVKKLAATPAPTTKTELQFFIGTLKQYDTYTKAILEFVKEEVSRLNQQHKDAVSDLKKMEEQVALYSQKDKAIDFANELLAQDPEFKIEGLTKRTTTKLVYDDVELLISIVKKPEYIPLIKLQTDAQIKKYFPTLEKLKTIEILKQITVEEWKEIK